MNKGQTHASGISAVELSQFSRYLSTQLGLHFQRQRWRDLESGVRAAAQELGFNDAAACVKALMSSPLTRHQAGILASHLVVGETYFFRERPVFTLLEQRLLPALIRSRRNTGRRLSIWSAACCTGEEPYSIAILLSRLIPDINDWAITILATDINPCFLDKAAAGVYRDWSFRNAPPGIKERYFQSTHDGGFAVLPTIKQRVTWGYLNLAQGAYPSPLNDTNGFDIIFCRNVLMYFEPQQAKKVVHHLHRALVTGGYLIVGASETSNKGIPGFVTVTFPDATLYQKDATDSERVAIPLSRSATQPNSGHALPRSAICPLAVPKAEKPQPSPYNESVGLFERRRYGEAVARLLVCLETDPDNAKAMTLLARAYAGQGKPVEALAWCQKAAIVDRFNPHCRYLLATLLQELGRIDEAIIALRQALYLDGHFILAHFALGNLTLRQGRRQDAARHFQNALSLLETLPLDGVVAEADGMSAGRLMEIIRLTLRSL